MTRQSAVARQPRPCRQPRPSCGRPVPVVAQPPADKDAKPKQVPHVIEQKSSVPGRADIPNAEVAKKLRGVAPPPIATPVDKLPLPQLKLPRGFRAEVYVSGIANARTLRLTERGTLFVSNRVLDKVWAVVDQQRQARSEGDRVRPRPAERPRLPQRHALHRRRHPHHQAREDRGQSRQAAAAGRRLLGPAEHPVARLALYRASARTASSTSTSARPVTSAIRCKAPRRSAGSISTAPAPSPMRSACATRSASTGIRCTKHLYFTDNGRDWLSEDLPEDELNRATAAGQHFGFPYCHQGDFTDREMGWGRSCDEFVKPVAKLGPHSAALGMRFYTGTHVPAALSRRHLHRPARLLEPHQEDRRRRGVRHAQPQRHRALGAAVPDRLPAEQRTGSAGRSTSR